MSLLQRVAAATMIMIVPFCIRTAEAEIVPERGPVDSRVRVIAYNADDVIKLRGFVGYQIHFQFAEGEEFVNLGAGDSGGLDLGAERNHLFLKPKQERVGTNLTIITNRRVYQMDYAVSKKPPDNKTDDVVYSLRFIYPQDEAKAAAAELEKAKTEAQLKEAAAARVRNIDYWYCGSDSIKPTSVYDDGVQTRIRYGAKSEFPAIFVKNDDETESLVNFNVESDEVVIHRVARQFVIRRGQLVGCIVNKAFDGGGVRLGTGTIAPGVQRDTKAAKP